MKAITLFYDASYQRELYRLSGARGIVDMQYFPEIYHAEGAIFIGEDRI